MFVIFTHTCVRIQCSGRFIFYIFFLHTFMVPAHNFFSPSHAAVRSKRIFHKISSYLPWMKYVLFKLSLINSQVLRLSWAFSPVFNECLYIFILGIRRVGRRPEQQGQASSQHQGGQGEGRPGDRRPDRRPPRERRFDKPADDKPEGGEFSADKWVLL